MKDLEIIIPAFNSHDTIEDTLKSIYIQKNLPDYHITIVNDCGNNYKELIVKYKDKLNIDEIKTPTNGGPGISRQYALDNTNSKYVIFVDSDDCFYDENSIFLLYNKINKTKVDIVISNFIYKKNNIVEIKERSTVWLHGKIYNREFINKNNIRFNNSRLNEDNGFNGLFFILNPVVIWINDITYVYNDNKNSLTRNDEYTINGMESYSYNINWVVEEATKRKIDSNSIGLKLLEGLHTMYETYVNNYNNKEADKIIIWSQIIYQKYQTYEKELKDIESNQEYFKTLKNPIISFEEFKNKIKESLFL